MVNTDIITIHMNQMKNSILRYALVFFTRVLGAFTILILNYYVANNYEKESAGTFFWFFSLVIVIVQLSSLGMNDVILKKISILNSQKRLSDKFKLIKSVINKVIISSVFFAVLSLSIIYLFQLYPFDYKIYLYLIVGVIAYTTSNVYGFYFQAEGKTVLSIFIQNIIPYFLVVIVSFLFSHSLENILFSLAVGFVLNHVFSIICFGFKQPENKDNNETLNVYPMALYMWAIAIMSVIVNWSGPFIVGVILNKSDVALYSISVRIANVLNFFLVAVNIVIAPKIAALYYENKIFNLQSLMRSVILSLYLISIPVTIVVIYWGRDILNIFGTYYTDSAYSTLVILTIGQVVNICTGPAGYMLSMTGNEKYMGLVYIISTSIFLILITLLTYNFGLIGSAVATATTNAIHNIVLAFIVKRKVSISLFPFIKSAHNEKI